MTKIKIKKETRNSGGEEKTVFIVPALPLKNSKMN